MPPKAIATNKRELLTVSKSGVHAEGTLAQKLLANGFDLSVLRTNATLRKDEWLLFDTAVVELARDRLVAVGDLLSRGLTFNLQNAMGTMTLEWQTLSDMRPASVSMDGITKAPMDRINYETVSLPIPITHHEFNINIRQLNASRKLGQTLDTTQVEESTLQVVEQLEDSLINGISDLKFGGDEVYGYTNHPNKNTVSLASDWDSSGFTGDDIIQDILAMITVAHGDRMFGPYVLYLPTAYGIKIEDDYKSGSDRTIVERILAIRSIESVKTLDLLSANNVLLIQMTKNVVDMVVGQQPSLVEWTEQGGMQTFFKVLAIMVPRVKATQSGQSGIVLLS